MFFLPQQIKYIIDKLEAHGYGAYVVGGAVRDTVIGADVHDYDITTAAVPDEVKRIFSADKTIETGIKHGTVTVDVDGERAEVTTFRSESVYSDGRHPDRVIFTDRLEDDLRRRDFTVNAMAYSPKTGLIDLFGGRGDIEAGLIRCVGDPYQRFSEDRLRIMRAIRFASVLGFKVEENTALAIHELKDEAGKVSAERIFSELKKTVCGKDAGRVLMQFGDVISAVIPEYDTRAVKFIDKTEPEPLTRLSVILTGRGPDAARKAMNRLKASAKETSFVCRAAENINSEPKSRADAARLIRRIGFECAETVFRIRKAAGEDGADEVIAVIGSIRDDGDPVTPADLKIDGGDVIRMTGVSGREVGELLEKLLDEVIDGRLENERAALEKRLKAVVS